MQNYNFSQSNALQQSLKDLYAPTEYYGLQKIGMEEDKARAAALGDYANRGMYSTGAGANQIAATVGQGAMGARGTLLSGLANEKASQVGALTRDIQGQNFQNDMAQQERQWQNDDWLRNTLTSLAGGFINPMVTGLGKGVGYNVMNAVAPNMLQDSLASYYYPSIPGAGGSAGVPAGFPYNPNYGGGGGGQNAFMQMLMQYLGSAQQPQAAPAAGW
jgi:hypothetical protein